MSTDDNKAREEKLLRQIRIQDLAAAGPMKPRIVQVIKVDDNTADEQDLQWEYYAGMGDTAVMPLGPEDHAAAARLIENGSLVATFEYEATPIHTVRLCEHFNDVRWGIDKNETVVAYKLWPAHHADIQKGTKDGEIVENDSAAALQKIARYLDHYRAMLDRGNKGSILSSPVLGLPVSVNGRTIYPIPTNYDDAIQNIRQRDMNGPE